MNKLLLTTKGFDLFLIVKRPITQDVQMASGASQHYLFRGGQCDPKFDNIMRDLAQGFDLISCNHS